MTRMNWRKVRFEKAIHKNGHEVHEDYLPQGPESGIDPPARPAEIVKKTPKKAAVATHQSKSLANHSEKAQRRQTAALTKEAKENERQNSFDKALADPQSFLNRAAEKTRRRWEKARNKLRNGFSK